MKAEIVVHTIEPVYDKNSKVLILGTMPSPKSREANFYYSHSQNRFWRVMADILNSAVPQNNDEKKELMICNNIALWDVLNSCEIKGADDNTIKNPKPNDINIIIKNSDIKAIFTTGQKATSLYKKYCFPNTNIASEYLPSTSPANCRNFSYNDIAEKYRAILKYIK